MQLAATISVVSAWIALVIALGVLARQSLRSRGTKLEMFVAGQRLILSPSPSHPSNAKPHARRE